jgi:hypothetical protein
MQQLNLKKNSHVIECAGVARLLYLISQSIQEKMTKNEHNVYQACEVLLVHHTSDFVSIF